MEIQQHSVERKLKTDYKANGKYLVINVISQGLALAIFVGSSYLCESAIIK